MAGMDKKVLFGAVGAALSGFESPNFAGQRPEYADLIALVEAVHHDINSKPPTPQAQDVWRKKMAKTEVSFRAHTGNGPRRGGVARRKI